ncbi:MAG TPA: CooT family nickel-binding protein [Methanothermococcus okinawensis]|uniref:CooT family nickel-binding protein n=1 Tax=Methanothermococcus okinawensis TaxID=155863 RepID=A0A833DRN1_9EURY|nr:CooT family nickel-binding protein [Methanothermococcus okinawensis]
MCNLNLYVNNQLVMEDVMIVEKKDNKIIVVDLFGESKEFQGDIVKIDLNENTILIEC